MSGPDLPRLVAAMYATWPAHAQRRLGPFTLREGRGAGRRASAATADAPVGADDIARAAAAMRDMGQVPVFGCPEGDPALGAALDAAGFTYRLAVRLWSAPVAALAAHELPRVAAFTIWEPLAIMAELWEECGVTAPRRAVMDRVAPPKTAILTRIDDKPAGAAFAACDGEVAMLHAMVTRPARRRRGAAGHALTCAARWAESQGATHLGLAVTADNDVANAAYAKLGMSCAGAYSYRLPPGKTE